MSDIQNNYLFINNIIKIEKIVQLDYKHNLRTDFSFD